MKFQFQVKNEKTTLPENIGGLQPDLFWRKNEKNWTR